MPFLFPPSAIDSRQIFLTLAYGELSYLEACSTLAQGVERSRIICEEIAEMELAKPELDRITKLDGIHKLGIPIGEVVDFEFETIENEISRFLGYFGDKQNFCLSLYCGGVDHDDYDFLASGLLSIVRQHGLRKAHLIRPHSGYEIHGKEVLSRQAIDFLAFKTSKGYQIGVTFFIPLTEEFKERATKRPVVSSEISLSPRLARILVNLSQASPRSVLLDPFCGSGTILIEAVLKGVNCIGVDRRQQCIANTNRNLEWVVNRSNSRGLGTFETIVGDATDLKHVLQGRYVDSVVTEPILLPRLTSTPGLKAASSMVKNASATYSNFLYSVKNVIRRGGRLVIVVPSIRTSEGKDVSLILEDLTDSGFRPAQVFTDAATNYPVRIGSGSTRWVDRRLYVYERL